MEKQISGFVAFLFFAWAAHAQESLLQSGPMVGYSDYREALLWVQTKATANVKFRYWEQGAPEKKWETREVVTNAATGFVAKLVAGQAEPGKKYNYELLINGKLVPRPYPLQFQTQVLWRWRFDPPAFSFAFGSCSYINEPEFDRPGAPYGDRYHIFKAITDKKPDFMLWGGDNTYLRDPDWGTMGSILKRYTHTRSLPELQPLFGGLHHYALWDDHDYGPNDADRGFAGKYMTQEAFNLFWGNPYTDVLRQGGITSTFEWADVQFFLLDDRFHRSPQNRITGKRQIIGDQQLEWLIDALASSQASFKFVVVGVQFLNPAGLFETFSTYPEEREKIIKAISAEKIPGVIFLTGDRHHTVLMKMQRENAYPLYDFTCSPLTAGIAPAVKGKEETYRVDGTLVEDRNFSIMEVSGPRLERVLRIVVYNANGEKQWEQTIKATELQYPAK